MRRILVGLVLVSAILLGSLAAGTPVNGDKSAAATTAGINLGTHVHAGSRTITQLTSSAAPRVPRLVALVVIALAMALAAAAVPVVLELPRKDRSVLRATGLARRGPPAPAFA